MENGNSLPEKLANEWLDRNLLKFSFMPGDDIARMAYLAGFGAAQHPHAADEALAHACKRCGKPVLAGGHFDVADIEGVVTVTNAFCEKHWQEITSRGE